MSTFVSDVWGVVRTSAATGWVTVSEAAGDESGGETGAEAEEPLSSAGDAVSETEECSAAFDDEPAFAGLRPPVEEDPVESVAVTILAGDALGASSRVTEGALAPPGLLTPIALACVDVAAFAPPLFPGPAFVDGALPGSAGGVDFDDSDAAGDFTPAVFGATLTGLTGFDADPVVLTSGEAAFVAFTALVDVTATEALLAVFAAGFSSVFATAAAFGDALAEPTTLGVAALAFATAGLTTVAFETTALATPALAATALATTALGAGFATTALETATLDPTDLDPTDLDPTDLETTAFAAPRVDRLGEDKPGDEVAPAFGFAELFAGAAGVFAFVATFVPFSQAVSVQPFNNRTSQRTFCRRPALPGPTPKDRGRYHFCDS